MLAQPIFANQTFNNILWHTKSMAIFQKYKKSKVQKIL
ncbi:hypothetical protein CZ794_06410 [Psychrobacter sp. JB385]|nr:hypothetical protein CZ794_06410 [Psychrobacter sp. JB385]